MKNLNDLNQKFSLKPISQIMNYRPNQFKMFFLQTIIMVTTVMFFFSLVIFFTEYLPFNEETVVIFCIFFAFLCIDAFAGNIFKDYFIEHINDITNLADKNMEEVKAILAVKGSQEIKCNYSLTRKKIFIYSLFLKNFNATDFSPAVITVEEEKNSN